MKRDGVSNGDETTNLSRLLISNTETCKTPSIVLCALSSQSRQMSSRHLVCQHIIVLEVAAAALASVWKPCSVLRLCCLAAGVAASLGHRLPRLPPWAQHHLSAPSCNTRRCQMLLQAASCLAWASHAEAAFTKGLGTTSGVVLHVGRGMRTQYAHPAKCGGSSMSATRGAAGSRSAAAGVAGGCATTARCNAASGASSRTASPPLPCLSHSSV